ARLPALLDRLRQNGLPNFYGSQRFGRDGETLALGMKLLREGGGVRGSPFLRKLALAGAPSARFNLYLARRRRARLLPRVVLGGVRAKGPCGGMFLARDVAAEQERFDRREIVSAGPIFGRKTYPSADEAERREAATLTEAGLSRDSFHGFGKLMQGTRRHNLV